MYKIIKNGVTVVRDFRTHQDAKEFAMLKGWYDAVIVRQ